MRIVQHNPRKGGFSRLHIDGFDQRHQKIGDRPMFPNTCLPWMMLSKEEREKVLEENELFCKFCLRFLRNSGGNSCGPGRHTKSTGYNGMCSVTDCENMSPHAKDTNLKIEIGIEFIRIHWSGPRVSGHRENKLLY